MTLAAAQGRDWRKRTGARFLLYAILLIGGLGMIFPFVWMFASSLKHAKDIYSLSLIPPSPTFDNYRQVLEETRFVRWFVNSLIIATITTSSVAFLFDSLAGYTLAKFNFPGRQIIFVAIISTLMVPTEMLVILVCHVDRNGLDRFLLGCDVSRGDECIRGIPDAAVFHPECRTS
ncbi:MAG: hypothetical protein R2839_11760 [Thermomicrobiales bacterium]